MPPNRGRDKEDVVYNGCYSVIKRSKSGSFAEMWMDLETVIPGEGSQKEKNKYYVLTLGI